MTVIIPTAKPPSFQTDPADANALLSATWKVTPTPLLDLATLADQSGFASLRLKDETNRMGAGSFKALGGRAAVSAVVQQHGTEVTVICASAGNHGLAVADGAKALGVRSVVYVADTVPEAFADRLRQAGAEVQRAGPVYEDAMARALRDAKAKGWHLISDSSWDGYRDIPARIMRGYCIMADEMGEVFSATGNWPSQVALQAGVGGMAAALAARIRATWLVQPDILIVEPDRAPCLSASHNAARPVRVEGPVSNMGRLDCKEPSLIAHEVLTEIAGDPRARLRFVQISDDAAERAAAQLAAAGLATTPSGAAGFAGLLHAELGTDAQALAIVTEGAEDG